MSLALIGIISDYATFPTASIGAKPELLFTFGSAKQFEGDCRVVACSPDCSRIFVGDEKGVVMFDGVGKLIGYSAFAGSVQCSSCSPGTEQRLWNQTSCLACQPGFAASQGQPCSSCPAGSFSGQNASQGCSGCLAGSFSASSSSTTCTLCPKGRFQALVAQTSCGSCSGDQFAPFPGSVSCTICTSGQVLANFSGCGSISCPVGTRAVSGVGTCQPCEPGTFAHANATACSQCAAGTYTILSNSVTCQQCNAPGLSW